eukprot:1422659-Rhodomonas_salina.1
MLALTSHPHALIPSPLAPIVVSKSLAQSRHPKDAAVGACVGAARAGARAGLCAGVLENPVVAAHGVVAVARGDEVTSVLARPVEVPKVPLKVAPVRPRDVDGPERSDIDGPAALAERLAGAQVGDEDPELLEMPE